MISVRLTSINPWLLITFNERLIASGTLAMRLAISSMEHIRRLIGFLAPIADIQDQLGSPGDHAAEGQIFVAGKHLPIAGRKHTQQAEPDQGYFFQQFLEGIMSNLPEQAILCCDGRQRVRTPVHYGHLVEHDDWFDYRHNVDLPLRAVLTQMDFSPDQHEHTRTRISFVEDRLPDPELSDLPGADNGFQISRRKVLEVLYGFEPVDQVLKTIHFFHYN
jgi:hypothetical protein